MIAAKAIPATSQPVAKPLPAASEEASAIRDAYIAARFPGAAYGGADLGETERVIRSARLYFEDGQHAKAAELLDLAIALHPAREEPWLARLEIAFLERAAPDFCDVARAFRYFHPASSAWPEAARLGRSLEPGHALFGVALPGEASHYGPWPDTPNWIQASWDLTAEVHAAAFHHAMLRRAPQDDAAAIARAA